MDWQRVIEEGDLEEIRASVVNGAELELPFDPNSWGWLKGARPLHLAAVEGSPEVVETLLELGAEVDSRGLEDRTALNYAANIGRRSICEVLLAAGADRDAIDARGRTALYVCNGARITDDELSELAELLYSDRAARSTEQKTGYTPLHKALANSRLRTAVALVRWGADPEALDRRGRRPHEVLGRQGDPERDL